MWYLIDLRYSKVVVLCLSISRSEFSVTNYYNALLVELCGTVLLYSDVSKVG